MPEVAPPKVAEAPKAAEALRAAVAGGSHRVVQIENPPAALLRLALGQTVNAEILNVTKPGQFFLRTAAGIVQATSLTDRLVLPEGSQIALKISAKSPALRAHLEVIARPSQHSATAPHSAVADTVGHSKGLAARLGVPATAGAQTLATPMPKTLAVTVTALAPAPAAPSPATGGPAVAGGMPALLRGEPQTVVGQVVRAGTGQHAVLQTPLGRIETAAPLPLRPGESVQLTLSLAPQSGMTENIATRSATMGTPGFLIGQTWDSLDETARVLTPESRQALAVTPMQSTRSESRDLPLLRLLISVMSGEPQPWQSAALVAGLQRSGRGELAGELQDEQRLAGQTVTDDRGDWRLTPAPFFQDERIHALRFYRRGGSEGGGSDEDGHATRFVVELDLSRYGLFQMDGLVHGKRFDLAVRSRWTMTESLKGELRAIYESAITGAGLSGQILFDDGPDWRAMPLPGGHPGAVSATA